MPWLISGAASVAYGWWATKRAKEAGRETAVTYLAYGVAAILVWQGFKAKG